MTTKEQVTLTKEETTLLHWCCRVTFHHLKYEKERLWELHGDMAELTQGPTRELAALEEKVEDLWRKVSGASQLTLGRNGNHKNRE